MKPENSERLQSLAELKDGWLDGECFAISPEILKLARMIIEEHEQDKKLFIFPTQESGIEITWDFESHTYSVYIDPKTVECYRFRFNFNIGLETKIRSRTISIFNSPKDILKEINEWLKENS